VSKSLNYALTNSTFSPAERLGGWRGSRRRRRQEVEASESFAAKMERGEIPVERRATLSVRPQARRPEGRRAFIREAAPLGFEGDRAAPSIWKALFRVFRQL